MKYNKTAQFSGMASVAPCAGAGIEINRKRSTALYKAVAPCAGAGIEISRVPVGWVVTPASPPARGRGLKL